MGNKQNLILIILIQAGILVGMLVKAMYPLMAGKEVILPVSGRDPRDLFRGNYVDLQCWIESIPLDSVQNHLPKEKMLPKETEVFVELRSNGKWHEAVAVYPEPQPGKLCIKGWLRNAEIMPTESYLEVRYGLDSYFAPKEMAIAIEDTLRNRGRDSVLTITVRVTESGASRIEKLNF